MKISEKGLQLIMKYEGFRGEAYLCPAKVWTIGWGTTRIDGKSVTRGMVASKEQAREYLLADVSVFEHAVLSLVKVSISQEMFDALVSFAYNVGSGNLSSSTLLKLLNSKEYEKVPAQFLRWSKAAGKVLPGLLKRRREEAEMFRMGIDTL
jgi:lysozyme